MVLPETRFPQFRSARNKKNNIAGSNLMENIVHENGTTGGVVSCDVNHQEDGVVRMKIIVKKQDIEQVLLQVLKFGKSKAHDQPSIRPPPASLSAEQGLINLLRKKRLSRANNNGAKQAGSRSSWSPALQSIPEELQA
ncbi:hypothetical protein I3760_06G121600 [Carya illinoinensis]|nr:hypothetical protein I3760_06G121600 [Carya illinoinensis]KAG6709197.1 hypothetical protein I3842_06G119800 [Carya illinoinensis]